MKGWKRYSLFLLALAFFCGQSLWVSLSLLVESPPPPPSRVASHDHLNDVTVVDPLPSSSSSPSPLAPPPQQQQSDGLPQLSLDWGHLTVTSPLAVAMVRHQADCSLPRALFRFRNRFGLGSDLHLWSVAVCNAMHRNVRVHTVMPRDTRWVYWDQTACRRSNETTTDDGALTCYFGQQPEPTTCPSSSTSTSSTAVNDTTDTDTAAMPRRLYRGLGRITRDCPDVTARHAPADVVSAALEVLFTRASDTVVVEARRQLVRVFGSDGPFPARRRRRRRGGDDNDALLITVHVRWGDKADEMTLVPMHEYIAAVHELASSSSSNDNNQTDPRPVHVFVATEDPRAVREFRRSAPSHWRVYVDAYHAEFSTRHRLDVYNGHVEMSRRLRGRPGLVSVASLLVALEADAFVLTTASNWSRCMLGLLRNVVDPRRRRSPPTRVIDLKPGEW